MGLNKEISDRNCNKLSTSIKSRFPKPIKPKKPLSLEQVFNEHSSFDASVLNPKVTDILLTPRSAKIALEMVLTQNY